MVDGIAAGTFTGALSELKTMSEDELKKAYTSREMEPHMSPEDWTPESGHGLLG
jgi:hypothetical protein